ncbi:MAG: hypothetical protein AABX17_03640 [Nanoarchaeota archaeon]|mgnify:CR=1 FL=1
MSLIEAIIYFVILVTSYPVAKLLAWLCEDEIVKDRKYFIWLAYSIIILAILLFIFYFNIAILMSLVYMLFLMAFLIRSGRKRKFRK